MNDTRVLDPRMMRAAVDMPRMIWVIRHGCTELNSEAGGGERIRGTADVPLNAQGREDAVRLAAQLAGSGIQMIYSSTLSRAFDTARPIGEACEAKIETLPGLKPWDLGELTGQLSSSAHPVIREMLALRPDEPLPGGESFNSFKNRTLDCVAGILRSEPGKLLAIVTHHRVERLLTAWDMAGQRADYRIDVDTMLEHGESCGSAQTMTLTPGGVPMMFGPKKSKASVNYGPMTGDDHCGICGFRIPSDVGGPQCKVVIGEIRPDYWCEDYGLLGGRRIRGAPGP